jgi:FdrA protein
MSPPVSGLIGAQLTVINVGLSVFTESLRQQGIEVAQVDWRPPAGGDEGLLALLDQLTQIDKVEDADDN